MLIHSFKLLQAIIFENYLYAKRVTDKLGKYVSSLASVNGFLNIEKLTDAYTVHNFRLIFKFPPFHNRLHEALQCDWLDQSRLEFHEQYQQTKTSKTSNRFMMQ